jgi:hypothetical protein
MPKPLPKKTPRNPAKCPHQWTDTKANGLVVHRRCQLCGLQLGVKPSAKPTAADLPPADAPSVTARKPLRSIDPTLKSALEMAQMYQTALETLVSGNIASYTLPTGVTVTRNNLAGVETTYRYWRKEALRAANGMKSVANMGLVWP